MANLRPEQLDVSTGSANNSTVSTRGYVDDAVAGENIWDRTTGAINTIHVKNLGDVTILGDVPLSTGTSDVFEISKNSESIFSLWTSSNTATDNPTFITTRTRGTLAGPQAAVQTGDDIADWQAKAYEGSNYLIGGQMLFTIDGTVGTLQLPTSFDLLLQDGVTPTPTSVFTVSSAGDAVFQRTGALTLNSGTTAQRPATPADGMVRNNTTDDRIEFYENGTWVNLNYNTFIKTEIAGPQPGTIDQSQTTDNGGSGATSFWQSFTPSVDSFLISVVFKNTSSVTNVTLEIFDGEGDTGTLLHTQSGLTFNGVTRFDLTTAVAQTAGNKLTAKLSAASALGTRVNLSGGYAGGISSAGAGIDAYFETYESLLNKIEKEDDDADVNIRGTTDTDLFYLDASTDSIGIGTSTPNTKLDVQGGQTGKMTTVNAATYNLLVSDYILNVTYTGTGAVAINLPSDQAVAGRVIHIKDAAGNAGTYNITVNAAGARYIDGSAIYVMSSNYNAISVYSDGTDWFIF